MKPLTRSVITQTSMAWSRGEAYYRDRALKAEVVLLGRALTDYLEQLQNKQTKMDEEHFVAYQDLLKQKSFNKMKELSTEYEKACANNHRLETTAKELYNFNKMALEMGHELNDLPLIGSDVNAQDLRLSTLPRGYDEMSGGDLVDEVVVTETAVGAEHMSYTSNAASAADSKVPKVLFLHQNNSTNYSETSGHELLRLLNQATGSATDCEELSRSSAEATRTALGANVMDASKGSQSSGTWSTAAKGELRHIATVTSKPAGSQEEQLIFELMQKYNCTKVAVCGVIQELRQNYGQGTPLVSLMPEVEKHLTAMNRSSKPSSSETQHNNILQPHKEPCGNQYCTAYCNHLKYKTKLCLNGYGKVCYRQNCAFAHGRDELRPLPKAELCVKYEKGQCRYAREECVFAHGESDLRGNRKVVALSADPEVSKSLASWNKTKKPASQCQENIAELDDIHSPDNFCPICFENIMNKKNATLECGHHFHKQCIAQWSKKEKTCPVCRASIAITEGQLDSEQ